MAKSKKLLTLLPNSLGWEMTSRNEKRIVCPWCPRFLPLRKQLPDQSHPSQLREDCGATGAAAKL
jgi:hypothetical protein